VVQGAPSHLPSPPIGIGDVVDKYRVERVIGVGAMGVVVAARHVTLEQIVAIKFLVEHRFGSREESIARFLGEARAAARIESDHVCRVSDVGMLPSGVPYMIMEHLDGNDLEEEIVSRGQLELVESVDYVLQALDAIAAAHQLGIVHRDLKPANLFLARRPDGSRRVKVLDFGISKADAEGKKRFTRETKSLGTPAYMPPEQVKDPMNVDHRADIWALGAILYEIITGQMAFVGTNLKEVLDRVLGEQPCPVHALRRDVPPELVAIVGRALAKDRGARWPTAATFARALAPFGTIGVVSGLASIQREVGSLASIPSIPPMRASSQHGSAPHLPRASAPYLPSGSFVSHVAPSVEPMVATVSGERQTLPDPSELSRRHFIAHDWAALQTRRRKARSAVLAMMAALLCAAAIAVVAYGIKRPRGVAPPALLAASPSAELVPQDDPPPAESMIVAAPALPLPSAAPSQHVHHAATSVYPAASTARPGRAPKRSSPPR